MPTGCSCLDAYGCKQWKVTSSQLKQRGEFVSLIHFNFRVAGFHLCLFPWGQMTRALST